jgi:hypothetical protein
MTRRHTGFGLIGKDGSPVANTTKPILLLPLGNLQIAHTNAKSKNPDINSVDAITSLITNCQ